MRHWCVKTLRTRGEGCMYQEDISLLLFITPTPRGDVMTAIRTAFRAWLDRLVPLMDGELSALDVFDGGRVAVERVPVGERVAV